jgi:hypothetical protein
LLQHGGDRPQEHLSGAPFPTAQQNEAPTVEFYCSLEEGCSGESCSGGVQISADRGISQKATCLVFSLAVLNWYTEHLRKLFFCSSGILETREHHMGVDQLLSCAFYFKSNTAKSKTTLWEILLLEEIQD